ncbi:MAG: hypothetical protein ACLFUS_12390, partial [Candidatus Sumerlaeia bacterium]
TQSNREKPHPEIQWGRIMVCVGLPTPFFTRNATSGTKAAQQQGEGKPSHSKKYMQILPGWRGVSHLGIRL